MTLPNLARRGFLSLAGAWMAQQALAADTLPVPRKADEVPAIPAGPLLVNGSTVVLRVRQVLQHDGLSPGDRLLNGQPDLQVGDQFLAEMVDSARPLGQLPGVIGGTVQQITAPGRFGKNGKLYLQLTQLVRREEDTLVPWVLDTTDFSRHPHLRGAMVNALFMGEGVGMGLSVASQFSFTGVNPLFMGIGAGAGLLVGTGLAAIRRGTQARLEPGDTYEVAVGSCRCRVLPKSSEMLLYPAQQPKAGASR